MSNFWKDLPAGFVGLSPMDGITDHPYRFIQKKYGNPAVVYTEFTSVEGLTHGASRLLHDFLFSEDQHPIVGQIYGHTPEDFRTVATILCQLGLDGVDINMGCPAKNVTHLGSGAALIKTPKLAQEIIRQTKAGIEDWVNGKTVDDLNVTEEIKIGVKKQSPFTGNEQHRDQLPVSVKTRIGFDQPVVEEWIPTLLEMEPAAIAVHGRTLKQQYTGMADWSKIAQAKEVAKHTSTIIMGNGDVKNLQQVREKITETGVDGILLGRTTMGNPWVFTEYDATIEERFAVAVEHAALYEHTFSHDPKYNFLPMRKHLGWYVKEFAGAHECRMKLVRANSAEEVEAILKETAQTLQEQQK